MSDVIQYAATVLSLIGLLLNVRKCRWCFIVWLGSNLLWCGWGLSQGAWGLALTQLAFAAVGLYGFRRWTQEGHHED